MRQIALVLAAAAAAVVTAEVKQDQSRLADTHDRPAVQNAVQAWWDALSGASSLSSAIEQHLSWTEEGAVPDGEEDEAPEPRPLPPRRRHGGHGHRGDPDKTIYEQIKESKYTTKFAKLVDEHDEIKQLLQDTKHNHTLFVPTDRAFERIPHRRHGHHGGGKAGADGEGADGDDDNDDDKRHKPPKEFILALLKYHLAPGLYPIRRIHASQTIPSELYRPALGGGDGDDSSSSSSYHRDETSDHPQRIRVSTTPLVHFTRLNFRARLLAGDFAAKNGLVHAIDALLVPPPNATALLRLLPAQFSTLALALETTGLADDLAALPRAGGGTVFAPGNAAWARLGPRLNGFLFSEPGRKYLRALVKYHLVVNETLYSDAYYRGGGGAGGERAEQQHQQQQQQQQLVWRGADGEELEGEEGEVMVGGGRGSGFWHVDLPSLLDGKPISVVGRRWKGFVSLVVNGFAKVVVRDGVADDGVIQVVNRVLIPPHDHPGRGQGRDGEEGEDEAEVSLEELKSRLEPYLETEESGRRESFGDL